MDRTHYNPASGSLQGMEYLAGEAPDHHSSRSGCRHQYGGLDVYSVDDPTRCQRSRFQEYSGDCRHLRIARHLFDANTVWLGLKRGQLQRNYVWRFIELCNAGLSVDEIKRQVMEPEEVAIDYQI